MKYNIARIRAALELASEIVPPMFATHAKIEDGLAALAELETVAAPQFVAGEVTREMCRRVVAAEAHDMHEWSPLDWLEAWRAELGRRWA